ncbi:MAG: hypothetical protein ISP90_13920 [Nevskia sp.]|nr:hypothetical protein [Nevskia sp.]
MSEQQGGAPQAPVAEFTVEAGHPSLPGHFPGDPVVPGVVLLDLAIAALRERQPELGQLAEVRWAKFLKPVRAGEAVTISLEPCAAAARLRLVCSTGSGVAVRGEIAFAPAGVQA